MDKWLKLLGLDRALVDALLMAGASIVTSHRFKRATADELKRNADEIRQFAEDRDWMLKSVREEAEELKIDLEEKIEELKRLERAFMSMTRQKVADAEYIRAVEFICERGGLALPKRDMPLRGA